MNVVEKRKKEKIIVDEKALKEEKEKPIITCSFGHNCLLTRQPYKNLDDITISEIKCKICSKKGKCIDGAYVCP